VNRHRRYRRNPGIGGGRGIVGMVIQGMKDGFMVTVGRGLTNLAASKIPFGQTSAISQGAVQLAVGTGLALGIKSEIGRGGAGVVQQQGHIGPERPPLGQRGQSAEQAMPLASGRQACSEAKPIPPSPPCLLGAVFGAVI
jgi:hypothetical protein